MVELTAAGKVFFEQAQRIVKQYDAAVRQGLNIATGVAGDIGIIFPSSIEGLLLIEELRFFRGKYPETNLNVQVVEPKHMYDKLKKRESDIAICWPAYFSDIAELEILPFRQYPIRVCVAANHPLAKFTKVSPEQLRRERAVILESRSNPYAYRNMRNNWVEVGFEPNSIVKVHRLDEILLMIGLDLGIGLLPTYVYEYFRGSLLNEEQYIRFIEIEKDGLPPMMELAIIYWKDNCNPALANLLMSLNPENTTY